MWRSRKDEATGKTWYDLTSRAFTVFLPVKSVGGDGDGRKYGYVVALRAVHDGGLGRTAVCAVEEGVRADHQ